jgi:hypothetical protein
MATDQRASVIAGEQQRRCPTRQRMLLDPAKSGRSEESLAGRFQWYTRKSGSRDDRRLERLDSREQIRVGVGQGQVKFGVEVDQDAAAK